MAAQDLPLMTELEPRVNVHPTNGDQKDDSQQAQKFPSQFPQIASCCGSFYTIVFDDLEVSLPRRQDTRGVLDVHICLTSMARPRSVPRERFGTINRAANLK